MAKKKLMVSEDEADAPDGTLAHEAVTVDKKALKTSTHERSQVQEAIQQCKAELRKQLKHEWLANGGNEQSFNANYEVIQHTYLIKQAQRFKKMKP